MKVKTPLLFILGFVIINLLSNSCKKDPLATVEALIARGTWVLASEQVYYYTGGTNTHVDTLGTNCLLTQQFMFNTDFTCSYKNFACIQQSASGTWVLSADKLTLLSKMQCKDTVSGGKIITDMPFDSARVVNLGQYSMVLETGNINPYYTATSRRRIVRYGFIKQ